MVQDLSIKEGGKKVTVKTEKGKSYKFDKEDFNEIVEKMQKKKDTKSHLHVQREKNLKKRMIDLDNNDLDIPSFRALVEGAIKDFLNKYTNPERRLLGSIPSLII